MAGRFWVWVEYKDASPDLDEWLLFTAASRKPNGSGTMLDESLLRDLSFDTKHRATAVSLAKRLAFVCARTREKGAWAVCVTDTTREDKDGRSLKIWRQGSISPGARARDYLVVRKKRKKKKRRAK